MSEIQKPASEGQTPQAIDLTKYVPKEDFEKLSQSSKDELAKLKTELEDAKLSLLDPEYIAFLESKKNPQSKIDDVKDKLEDDSLSKTELKELRDELRRLQSQQADIFAQFELQAVEKKYKDFGDVREDVAKLLETSRTPLTIEQAYLLVKSKTITEKSQEEKETAARTHTEKPSGTVPGGGVSKVKFTSKADAGEDAWNKVVGAGKETL